MSVCLSVERSVLNLKEKHQGETRCFKLLGEPPSVTDAFQCFASVSISSVTLTQQGRREGIRSLSTRVAPYCKLVLALSF